MPPATNVRLDVARWLVEHIREALPTAQVNLGWPGDNMKIDAIWIDEIDGQQELPVMVAGRRHRDDKFVIPFLLRSMRPLEAAAFDALSVLIAGVEDVLAEAHTLDDDIDGVLSAAITAERSTVVPSPSDGHSGWARIEISVHARLT